MVLTIRAASDFRCRCRGAGVQVSAAPSLAAFPGTELIDAGADGVVAS